MSRRASIIESEPGNVIYVDVGGTPAGVTEYHLEKFLAILNGEKELGIVAHNLGVPELDIAVEDWDRFPRQSQVPFLSTNAEPSTKNTSGSWIKKSVFVQRNDKLIQILGVVSPRLSNSSNWKIADPKQAVLSEIAGSRADIRVLLAYAEETELIDLAKSIPELSFVIGGPTGQTLPPRRHWQSDRVISDQQRKILGECEAHWNTRSTTRRN